MSKPEERYSKIALLPIIVFNFIFYLYALSKYPLSYGIDGPYYNIQVRYLLTGSGLQASDLPLAYYLLTPFIAIFGQFTGLKVGMAFFGALFPIPVYLTIIEIFDKHRHLYATLGSVLVSFNWFNLRMVEDFMQNFIGVLWLLCLLYILPLWLEKPSDNKLMILSFVFLLLTVLTHLYAGGMAIVLFCSLIAYRTLFFIRQGQFHPSNKSILFVLSFLIIAIFVLVIFPNLLSPFSKIITFLGDIGSGNGGIFFITFFSIPYIVGFYYLVRSLKSNNPTEQLLREDYYQSAILILALVILGFSLPLIPAEWGSRLILLAFIPITFLSIFFVDFVGVFVQKQGWEENNVNKFIYFISVVFMISAIISAATFIPSMGPSVTANQYDELQYIKTLIPDQISPDGVILTTSFELSYWIRYVLDMQVIQEESLVSLQLKASLEYYQIVDISNSTAPFSPETPVGFNLFLPYKLLNEVGSRPSPGGPANGPPGGPQPSQVNPPSGIQLPGDVIFQGNHFIVIYVTNI